MSLLMASVFDAKNKIILLAFALVPAESKEWWTWFLRFVSNAFPNGINNEDQRVVCVRKACAFRYIRLKIISGK